LGKGDQLILTMTLVFDEKDEEREGEQDKATFSKIRIQKILEYAERQKKRTSAEKENDFQAIDEFQQGWVDARIKGSKRSWEVWNADDQVKEEWEPWDRYGQPVNRRRRYKLK
jgi:hypothetical protein